MAKLIRNLQRLVFVITAVAAWAAQPAATGQPEHVGRVMDWTYRHITVSGGLSRRNLRAARSDPRILFHLAQRNLKDGPDPRPRRDRRSDGIDGGGRPVKKDLKIDWNVSLGAGNVAPNMSPAKYSFGITAANCNSDYVVYALNVAGALNGQANLVAINKLYSGTGTGVCAATPSIYWAYNGSTANGAILTSPLMSLDGSKIAYIESAANSTIFHILTWKSGQGTSATKAANPTTVGSCSATTSCLASVTLSSSFTDSFGSPWIDYQTDKGFAASDDGTIYRISCVFKCAANTNPTIDWSFQLPVAGTGGALPKPNGPIYNYPFGLLFVGDQLGELWAINAGGSTPSIYAGPVMIGGGGCTVTNPPGRTGTPNPCTANGGAYGIPDSIILDASGGSERVYAFSGNDGTAGASAVVVQLKQDFTGMVRVHIGLGGVGNNTNPVDIHTGAFDNEYWGANPQNNGHLFVCGTGASDMTPYHYWIKFTGYPVMNSTPTGSLQRLNAAGVACAPYIEFYNPNLNLGGVAGHHDLLISGLVSPTNGYIITNDISSGNVIAALNFVQYAGGISSAVIDGDNVTQAQASSIYFSTLAPVTLTGGTCNNTKCAIKLTQANLQ